MGPGVDITLIWVGLTSWSERSCLSSNILLAPGSFAAPAGLASAQDLQPGQRRSKSGRLSRHRGSRQEIGLALNGTVGRQ